MNGRFLKGLCVASGLLCFAAGAVAQDNAIISTDQMSRAQDDIAKMDETELRSLTGVLVECRFVRVITSPQALAACQLVRETYQIEYHRDRAIDTVLDLLQVVSMALPSQAANRSLVFESGDPGRITLEDIKRVLEQMPGAANQPAVRIGEVEQALRRKVSESFKSKRAQ